MRPSSLSRDRATAPAPERRGRDVEVDTSRIHSTGRGGIGNMRSPSIDGKPAFVERTIREEDGIGEETSFPVCHSPHPSP
jgi:hypothetical protein